MPSNNADVTLHDIGIIAGGLRSPALRRLQSVARGCFTANTVPVADAGLSFEFSRFQYHDVAFLTVTVSCFFTVYWVRAFVLPRFRCFRFLPIDIVGVQQCTYIPGTTRGYKFITTLA